MIGLVAPSAPSADDGSMSQCIDRDPFDGSGADLAYGKDIDTWGWTQKLISAVPSFND